MTTKKLIKEVEFHRGIVSSDPEITDVVLTFLRDGYDAKVNRRLGEAIDLYRGVVDTPVYRELCRRWNEHQPLSVNQPPVHAMSQVGAQAMIEEKKRVTR